MSKVIKLIGVIYVAVEDDTDLEGVAASMDTGMTHALDQYPHGEVLTAGIDSGEVHAENVGRDEIEAMDLETAI